MMKTEDGDGDDDFDDYDAADLKAHLARIDPAKIAGPLETAFQDVVNFQKIINFGKHVCGNIKHSLLNIP